MLILTHTWNWVTFDLRGDVGAGDMGQFKLLAVDFLFEICFLLHLHTFACNQKSRYSFSRMTFHSTFFFFLPQWRWKMQYNTNLNRLTVNRLTCFEMHFHEGLIFCCVFIAVVVVNGFFRWIFQHTHMVL